MHDHRPEESALEQNHFSQMTACSGGDSSSGEVGIPDVAPRSPWNEQRETGPWSPQHTLPPSRDRGLELRTDVYVDMGTHHRLPPELLDLGGLYRPSGASVTSGGFYPDSSHYCDDIAVSTCQIPN